MAEEAGTQDPAGAPAVTEWVRIVSSDGYSCVVSRAAAMRSGTLKNMLDTEANFSEAERQTCHLQERGIVVEKVVEYLLYKTTYENTPAKVDIPDFFERIQPEIALEVLQAADFLEA